MLLKEDLDGKMQKEQKANSEIDFNLLFNVFQVIMGEIKSLHPYLPFQEELFDLVILDEASQLILQNFSYFT